MTIWCRDDFAFARLACLTCRPGNDLSIGGCGERKANVGDHGKPQDDFSHSSTARELDQCRSSVWQCLGGRPYAYRKPYGIYQAQSSARSRITGRPIGEEDALQPPLCISSVSANFTSATRQLAYCWDICEISPSRCNINLQCFIGEEYSTYLYLIERDQIASHSGKTRCR